ncbi:hypothetical protein CMI45_00085 [Candidatus Pacearchaeota archaeon]|nr:hypothetical protein [Candidatus Pacearchaeota archaeon]|tara:strand:+ start:1215 stop:1763 length:549 start_codon:yes stop_codon:yes gene_type:complete
MKILDVNYSNRDRRVKRRGQVKIQQMAFVLVALMIFFALVSLIFFKIKISDVREGAVDLKEEEAKELVRKLAGSPEFSFTASSDCSNCIDLDKTLMLSERQVYDGFWNLDYLAVERVFPSEEEECSRQNYPDCNKIEIIGEGDSGAVFSDFVSLCRWEQSGEKGYFKCEIGRILASGEGIGE